MVHSNNLISLGAMGTAETKHPLQHHRYREEDMGGEEGEEEERGEEEDSRLDSLLTSTLSSSPSSCCIIRSILSQNISSREWWSRGFQLLWKVLQVTCSIPLGCLRRKTLHKVDHLVRESSSTRAVASLEVGANRTSTTAKSCTMSNIPLRIVC